MSNSFCILVTICELLQSGSWNIVLESPSATLFLGPGTYSMTMFRRLSWSAQFPYTPSCKSDPKKVCERLVVGKYDRWPMGILAQVVKLSAERDYSAQLSLVCRISLLGWAKGEWVI